MANTKIPVELSSTPGIVDNSNATAITIDSSENVGIGGSPSKKLTVSSDGVLDGITMSGANAPIISVTNTQTTSIARMLAQTTFSSLGTASNHPLVLITNDTERLRIDTSGNVGIGTTSPARQLHVNSGTSNVVARFESTDSRAVAEFKDPSGTAELGNIGNDIYFAPAGSEKVRIDSSGLVGIGTSSGTGSLHVTTKDSNGSDVYYVAQNTTSNRLAGYKIFDESGNTGGVFQYDNGGNALNIGTAINTHFSFNTNNTERMRINGSGYLLVGKTIANTNTNGLTVSPNDFISYTNDATDSGDRCMLLNRHAVNAGDLLSFRTQNVDRGIISFNGSVMSYGGTSDYRLKQNIKPMENGLERLNRLNPVSFNWKETGINSEGFIAHEVQEVFADVVTGEKDGKQMQTVDYGRITPLLVKAIQEQQAQIEALQSEINLLKGE